MGNRQIRRSYWRECRRRAGSWFAWGDLWLCGAGLVLTFWWLGPAEGGHEIATILVTSSLPYIAYETYRWARRFVVAPVDIHQEQLDAISTIETERNVYASVAAGRQKNQALADELTRLRVEATHNLINDPPRLETLNDWMVRRNTWLERVEDVMRRHRCTEYEISLVRDIQHSEVMAKLKPYKQSYNVMMLEVRVKYLNAIIQSYEESPSAIREITA